MTSCMKHFSFDIVLGIIYDVIVEPPSVGSTTDEFGHSKPVSLEQSSKIWNIKSKHSSKGLIGWFVSKAAKVSEFSMWVQILAGNITLCFVWRKMKPEYQVSKTQHKTVIHSSLQLF